jgi:hypothetical protein
MAVNSPCYPASLNTLFPPQRFGSFSQYLRAKPHFESKAPLVQCVHAPEEMSLHGVAHSNLKLIVGNWEGHPLHTHYT